MKKTLLLVLLLPLLLAFQCDDDQQQNVFYNDFKVLVTAAPTLHVNDTVWVEGRVSSKVYSSEVGDSVFVDMPEPLELSIYRFITPTPDFTAQDAIDNFEIIYPPNLIDFLGFCPNSTMHITPTLDASGNLYRFRVGLRARYSGDYIFKFTYQIQNTDRNLEIINDHPSLNSSYLIGFNSCGNATWALNTSEGDFCIRVN